MSTTSSNLTVSTKYQQLVAEYSKLRNQVPLLKKAVVVEQTKNSELTDQLTSVQQRLRKCDSEIDSLSFRNLQLTRRVESLQSMLDDVQKRQTVNSKTHKRTSLAPKLPNSHSDFFANATGSSLTPRNYDRTLLEEELQRTLAENEKLHKMIYDQSSQYENERLEMMQKIEKITEQLEQYGEETKELSSSRKIQVSSLNGQSLMRTKRSPLFGSLNSEPISETPETSSNNGDHISPDCSNCSSLTSSSQNNFAVPDGDKELSSVVQDLNKQLEAKQKELTEAQRAKDIVSLENQLLALKCDRLLKAVETDQPKSIDTNDVDVSDYWSQCSARFYDEKLNDLNCLLQLEQAKSVHFDNECRHLLEKFHIAQQRLDDANFANRESDRKMSLLKDELETMRVNYEAQIRSLTELLTQSSKSDDKTNSQSSKPVSKKSIFR